MRKRRVMLEYGIEFEARERRWVVILGEAVLWVGLILMGMGLAWILMALGAGGSP